MNTQQIINVGTAPNDGLGDPIRTAFIKTNENFANLWALPNPSIPTTLIGKDTDTPGMYAYDSGYFYYCFSNYDGTTAIWAKVPQVESISVPLISNGNSNVSVSANSNVTVGVTGTANVATFTTTGIQVTSNVSAANINATYFYGDGSHLTNVSSNSYSNANVTSLLPVYTGNLSANNITAGNNITAINIFPTGVVSATGNVRGGNINTVGLVSATGNVIGNYIIGDGSQLTGLPQPYGNANVTAYLPTYTGGFTSLTGDVDTTGSMSATGNVYTAGYFIGNFQGNVTGNVTVAGSNTQVLFNDAGNIGAAGGLTFDVNGPNLLTVLGTISAQGNIRGNNIVATNFTYANGTTIINNYSNSNVGSYLLTNTGNIAAGNVSVTGNVKGNYIIGNGAFLTDVVGNYSNSSVAAYLPTYNGNIAVNVIQGNVGSFSFTTTSGNLVSNGYVSATGNVRGGNINTVGLVSATGNIYTAGNVYANNIIATTDISTTGKVYAATAANGTNTTQVATTAFVTSAVTASGGYGDAQVETLLASGNVNTNITTTANISGAYFLGNGATLSSITGANVTGIVNNATNATYSTYAVSATGATTADSALIAGTVITGAQPNITSVGTLSSVYVSGAISVGGNILTTVSAVGNIGSTALPFNTVFAKATSALYADLAEHYLADAEYAPGTVVSFGGNNEVTQSTQDLDVTVAGIISTNPAYRMNSGLEGKYVAAVALQGRVPCRVTGPVTKGAMMVSNGDGSARAERNPVIGSVLGKALESFNGDVGIIEVVVGRL